MQRDFQINALRTKTKYKLTALRVGMKEHILNGLTSLFDSTTLKLPMLAIMEALEDGDSRAEDAGEEAALSKRRTRNKKTSTDTLKLAEKEDGSGDASLVLSKNLTEVDPNDEETGAPSTAYKPPGLRRYNKGMGSSVLEDSAVDRPTRGNRPRAISNDSLSKSNAHGGDAVRMLRRNSILKSSGDSKPKVKIPPQQSQKGRANQVNKNRTQE